MKRLELKSYMYIPSTQFSEIFDSKTDSKALERGDSWHFLMPVETGLWIFKLLSKITI